ncbi:hypothetical protein E4U60_004317 [Claviceps pazoutovae]|uniref:non-specific serine/threonine protein kinase n=1 Tax=Claviceps pazoutovae TaxID=1649127 RepID=A0A9P7M9D7_9HYPO|nr:hypothetical protein E4U60_004317 [Claviceps pazoutovae]
MSLFSRCWNMLVTVVGRSWKTLLSPAWKPLAFPSESFALISANEKIEEETLPDYVASQFYPVKIFRARYQIVGKLGYGVTSTVWLTRDLSGCRHVALKIHVTSNEMGEMQDVELDAYVCIENSSINHPGRRAIRSLLDSVDIDGPDRRWAGRGIGALHRNPIRRLPTPVMDFVLLRLFLALDFLHRECHTAHTDIQERNILFGADKSVLEALEQEELENPCPRKDVDGRTIYLSRKLGIPKKVGDPVLCDLGSALRLGDGITRREDIQPDVYRAPEVILGIPCSYSVYIWNVGCMIWNAFEGEHLFIGRDPEFKTYRGRTHLAEIIALLGPPSPSLLPGASLRSKFFSDAGEFCADISIPESEPLGQSETVLEGEDRDRFLRFMRKMLQWDPEKRSSAEELAEDEWVLKRY